MDQRILSELKEGGGAPKEEVDHSMGQKEVWKFDPKLHNSWEECWCPTVSFHIFPQDNVLDGGAGDTGNTTHSAACLLPIQPETVWGHNAPTKAAKIQHTVPK